MIAVKTDSDFDLIGCCSQPNSDMGGERKRGSRQPWVW